MARGSRRCAAEPTPAARVTITLDRAPVPQGVRRRRNNARQAIFVMGRRYKH